MKKVMLEKISTQKTELETIREALNLRYERGDIPSFSKKADKVQNQDKVGGNVKFDLLRDPLKSDQLFFLHFLLKRFKKNASINQT